MNVFYRKLLFRLSQEEQARGSLELGVPSCTVIGKKFIIYEYE